MRPPHPSEGPPRQGGPDLHGDSPFTPVSAPAARGGRRRRTSCSRLPPAAPPWTPDTPADPRAGLGGAPAVPQPPARSPTANKALSPSWWLFVGRERGPLRGFGAGSHHPQETRTPPGAPQGWSRAQWVQRPLSPLPFSPAATVSRALVKGFYSESKNNLPPNPRELNRAEEGRTPQSRRPPSPEHHPSTSGCSRGRDPPRATNTREWGGATLSSPGLDFPQGIWPTQSLRLKERCTRIWEQREGGGGQTPNPPGAPVRLGQTPKAPQEHRSDTNSPRAGGAKAVAGAVGPRLPHSSGGTCSAE